MNFSVQADFKGDINLTQSADITDDLNNIIEVVEKKYLRRLLGDDLYLLFIDGYLSGKYKLLLDGETVNTGARNWIYEGLKKMLNYFVFAKYKIATLSEDTTIGTVRQNKENSTNLSKYDIEKISNVAFNKGVDLYYAAYDYLLLKYSNDFPSWRFYEIKKRYHFGINSVV